MKTSSRKKSGNGGFTLVELLLSAAILAFAIVGMLSVFSNCLLLNTENREALLAASHAQYMLEAMKNAAFPTLAAAIDGGQWDFSSSAINATGLSALSGESIATVRGASSNPLEVNVTVNWNDQFNHPRSMFLDTLIQG